MEWTPSLKQLEILMLVERTGSLTEVAQMLGVTQPAVSHSLREMEQNLGYRLFIRSHGSVKPTPQALLLMPQVTEICGHLESLFRHMRKLRAEEEGELRVVALNSLSATLMPRAIHGFATENPLVRVTALVASGREITDMLRQRSVDFGLVYTAADAMPAGSEALLDTQIVCFAGKGQKLPRRRRITLADLAGRTVIVPSSSTVTGALVRRSLGDPATNGINIIEVNNAFSALSLVHEGLGLALVDPMLVDNLHSRGLSVWPFEPSIVLRLVALCARPRDRMRVADRFIANLRAVATETVGMLRQASIEAAICEAP
jgi:DNA-binding transcriptional LysR family regulator